MRSEQLANLFLLAGSAFGKGGLAPANVSIPLCATSTFSNPEVGPGAEIISITAVPQYNFTSIQSGGLFPLPDIHGLKFCQVQVNLTHAGSNDNVLIELWLPIVGEDWNGRFLAVGGGGTVTGIFSALGPGIRDGYAVTVTDGGHSSNLALTSDFSWAWNGDGTINYGLISNFATRSVVEEITIGKALTEQYFGRKPHHSYWEGCSTGGRQGYSIAQKHPDLVDGIVAVAPAISMGHFVTGEVWAAVIMQELDTFLSNCEFQYFSARAVDLCDNNDGLLDGVIEDPFSCEFNPYDFVGDRAQCDGQKVEITEAMARLVSELQNGFRTFDGQTLVQAIPPGVPMYALGNITIAEDGTRTPNPFPLAWDFLRYLVLKNPEFNLADVRGQLYERLFALAEYELGGILNCDNPDLSALQASGTKLLTWHGLNDQLLPVQNTIEYRRRVESTMGGRDQVNEYYRLFLAPGVGHCGGDIGPTPTSPLNAIIAWVENGEAPQTLTAQTFGTNETITKELCAWPGHNRYDGSGDPNAASSYICEGGIES